jgi:hypothetical protein
LMAWQHACCAEAAEAAWNGDINRCGGVDV